MKLSKRLSKIQSLISNEYTHIWDCCCDHGYLGMSLLANKVAPNIHFVDIVPDLIDKLTNKLSVQFGDSSGAWNTHCVDVNNLPLKQHEGKHLVIIAGVGGDLTTRFINSLHQENVSLQIDYLLCPIRQQFSLRKRLIELSFSLKNESLVEENNKLYEILHVSSLTDDLLKISDVGDFIWSSETTQQALIAKKYMTNTLNHYRRMRQRKECNVQHIIDAYNRVLL